MRIIDRYIVRQVLMPFCIGLVVFTFVFIIRTLMDYVEPLVAKGISALILVRVILLLIPQALALSIPMSLLLGLLVAFGKLSANREFVALQACGISLRRLLLPVGFVSLAGWAATSYVMLVGVPESNQAFRELTFGVMADRAEGEVKPRVFFDDFPNLVLYVRDVPAGGGGWNGVFMADFRPGQPRSVYIARRGGVIVDRQHETVQLVLEDVFQHTPDNDVSDLSHTARLELRVDPESLFPKGGPLKTEHEMTIAELRDKIAFHESKGISTHNQRLAIYQKFSIPVACIVFGVIGLALGATNRRDSALGSFGLGIAVVFAYYVPLFLFPQMMKGGWVTPWLAAWLPNILLGAFALVLFVWRDRVADQPLRLPLWLRRRQNAERRPAMMMGATPLRLLDHYIASTFVRVLLLTLFASLAVFYISTFIDLSDKMFKGTAPWYAIFEYLLYFTPQIAYYTLPLSVLIATLVTVGLLTASSELIVMKACGVSLYRATLPMLLCSAVVGGLLFALDATILGAANREAETLRNEMRGVGALNALNQPWMLGDDGAIYNIRAFDRRRREFSEVNIWKVDKTMSRLIEQTFAERASYIGGQQGFSPSTWQLQNGWTRAFDAAGRTSGYRRFASEPRQLEKAAYFAQEPPDARFMSFGELRRDTARLSASGLDVLDQQVALARKVAFPFVTIIMTLIAIPFAVTIGRSGTMAGIGVGVALALGYWGAISISVAFGAGGALSPVLSAWAPNLLFGAGAVYLLLTVRT
jgi:LPS export ABC transporter permease LptG/LPS export ABC transporter permease LptF